MELKFEAGHNDNGTITIYQVVESAGKKKRIKCQNTNNMEEAMAVMARMEYMAGAIR